jgi:hypothetical protein
VCRDEKGWPRLKLKGGGDPATPPITCPQSANQSFALFASASAIEIVERSFVILFMYTLPNYLNNCDVDTPKRLIVPKNQPILCAPSASFIHYSHTQVLQSPHPTLLVPIFYNQRPSFRCLTCTDDPKRGLLQCDYKEFYWKSTVPK